MNIEKHIQFNLINMILSGVILIDTKGLGYFLGDRSHILLLWTCLSIMFVAYFVILKKYHADEFSRLNNYLAIISRLILLFSFPLLSDDIYRFIWDGAQILHGIN